MSEVTRERDDYIDELLEQYTQLEQEYAQYKVEMDEALGKEVVATNQLAGRLLELGNRCLLLQAENEALLIELANKGQDREA